MRLLVLVVVLDVSDFEDDEDEDEHDDGVRMWEAPQRADGLHVTLPPRSRRAKAPPRYHHCAAGGSTTAMRVSAPLQRISGTYIAWPSTGNA